MKEHLKKWEKFDEIVNCRNYLTDYIPVSEMAYYSSYSFFPEPCVTLAYLEPCHIQNLRNIRSPVKHLSCRIFLRALDNLGIFRILVYSEPALHKKWSFPLRISSVRVTKSAENWPNPHKTADLATFTEEILNGKLHILSSAEGYSELCLTSII